MISQLRLQIYEIKLNPTNIFEDSISIYTLSKMLHSIKMAENCHLKEAARACRH